MASRPNKVVQIVCTNCGATAMRTRQHAARPGNIFCSISCGAKFRGDPGLSRIAATQARVAQLRATEQARFWAKIRRGAPHECWEWTGRLTIPNGYGRTSWRGKELVAHRIALSLTDGLWDSDLSVCHTCDNRLCCNPAHLWRGTYADNIRDMRAKGRQNDPRGEANHKARLTEEQVIAIRQSSERTDVLASNYGISPETILGIRKRRTWRHLP